MRFFFKTMKKLLIEFPLSKKGVSLTTTTNLGNLAYQVDEGRKVKEPRLLLAKTVGLPIERFTYVHQSHSDKVKKVTLDDLGKGNDRFEDGLDCDALYTYEKNVPLCIFHADCVPVFFINEKADLVGIIHAGFKGTMKHVTHKTMKYICKRENLSIEDFKFYIGPYRQANSFIVDKESKKSIIKAGFGTIVFNNKFDTGLANKMDLYDLGVEEKQITSCKLDTLKDDRFFSAAQKTPVGRLVSLIYLK